MRGAAPARRAPRSKVAIVTGATGGIGRACATTLARAGYRIAAIDLDAPARRWQLGSFHVCDVAEAEAVRRTVAAVLARWGRIDALIACAGVVADVRLEHASSETVERLIAINLTGTINTVQACIPALTRARGAIVTVSSAQAHRPSPGLAVYAATKGGIESLTKGLAVELAPDVRVNAVSPGLIRTPILLEQRGVTPRTYAAYVRRRARGYLLGRIGEPADIAAMVAYLVSERARWITGAIVPVDGGKSVGGG